MTEVKETLENGANVNERYGFLRSTWLMKAVDRSDEPLVSFLLQQPGIDVNAKDIDGNAALHHIHGTNETATTRPNGLDSSAS